MDSSNKQTNYHFQYSILIRNTQENVWNFLINVDRWKEWDTELKSSSLFDNFGLGARGVLIPKEGPKLKFHIISIVPYQSYTFVTKLPVGTLEIKRTLDREGEQIKFTDDIKFTGFFKRVFGLMLGRGFKSVLPEVMENFKEIAEKE